MSAKSFISKLLISIICLAFTIATADATAQQRDTVYIYVNEQPTSSSKVVQQSDVQPTRYDRRVHRYRKHWNALIPTHIKVQYAGNMGLLSFGTGWDYGRRNQWETDVYLGFVPKYHSDKAKATFTLKQNYLPWSFQIKESPFSIEPLTCGLYLNTVFGNEFWVREPERYPSGYYGFSSKVRIHIFLGQRVTFSIPEKMRWTARQIAFFYEISTCDLYLISAATNRYLRPRDYLSLSFGLKLQLL